MSSSWGDCLNAMFEDDFPVILGFGSCHDMEDKQPQHRFWQLKSTSRAAAVAYSKGSEPKRNPIGFHKPK